jgi:signal peptidase
VRRHWRLLTLVAVLLAVAGSAYGYVRASHLRVYSVRTGSMAPYLHPGDAVIDRPSRRPYQVGDVVTFRPAPGSSAVVTHRIHSIDSDGIHTKGDANRTPDTWAISASQIVGRVDTRLPRGGYVLVYFQHPAGVASAMTGALALFFLWGLFWPDQDDAEQLAERDGDDTYPVREEPATSEESTGERSPSPQPAV